MTLAERVSELASAVGADVGSINGRLGALEQGAAGALMIVGDSYTDGVGSAGTGFARLAPMLLDAPPTVVSGNPGYRVDQLVPVVRAQLDANPGLRFSAVVVEGGMNDVASGADPATTRAAYLALRDEITAAGAIPVFTGVPPHQAEPVTALSRPINAWLADNAALEGWKFVSLDRLVDPATGVRLPAYTYDDLHVNALGHEVMAEALRDTLAPLLPPRRGRLPAYSGARFDSVLTGNQLFNGAVYSGLPEGWDTMNGVTAPTVSHAVIDPPADLYGWRGRVFRINVPAGSIGHAVKRWVGADQITGGGDYALVGRLRLRDFSGVPSGSGVTLQVRWNSGDVSYLEGPLQYDGADLVFDKEATAPAAATSADITVYIDLGGGSGIVDLGEVDLINLNARTA